MDTFENIPLDETMKVFQRAFSEFAAAHPEKITLLQAQLAHVLPEMGSLLQKRNRTPDEITPADVARITTIVEEVIEKIERLVV